MKELKVGDMAPDFTLPGDGGREVALSAYRGRKVVLYFYPKDDTSGCTAESCSFRDNIADFNALGTDVIGLSKDSPKSHDKFKAKYDLNFPLASDETTETCQRYGVWVEKSMYGRKYMGVDRSTFLIDEQGRIAGIWRGVKVPGHVEDVREAVRGLANAA